MSLNELLTQKLRLTGTVVVKKKLLGTCEASNDVIVPISLSDFPDFQVGTAGNDVLAATTADNVKNIQFTVNYSVKILIVVVPVCDDRTADVDEPVTLKDAAPDFSLVAGFGGNDTITGLNAFDILLGDGLATADGSGNDTINAQDGDDLVVGGGGNDTIVAGSGADIVFGDLFLGLTLDPIVIDATPDDPNINVRVVIPDSDGFKDGRIFWGAGAQRRDAFTVPLGGAASGNDTISGGTGADTLIGDAGNDTIDGGADDDLILGGTGSDSLIGGTGKNTLIGDLVVPPTVLGVPVADGEGNDTLIGNTADDILLGDGADDSLVGNAGNDTLIGGADGDGGSNDTLLGGDGNDLMIGDWLLSAAQQEALILDQFGVAGQTFGPDGNDSMGGGTGNDTMFGDGGNDTMNGGAGDDVVVGGTGSDSMTGGTGKNTMIGDLLAPPAVLGYSGAEGNDTLIGDSDDDILLGDGVDDSLVGNAGNDIMIGGADGNGGFNDTLIGGAGNDLMIGDWALSPKQQQDLIFETFGVANTTFGPDGRDTLSGGTGDDTMLGDGGADTLDGGDGNDLMIGGTGADSMIGGSGQNIMIGDLFAPPDPSQNYADGEGNDTLIGGNDVDSMFGDGGNDSLVGNGSDDIIVGGANNDTALGGDGNDIIIGDWLLPPSQQQPVFGVQFGPDGNDSLSGGTGNDTVSGDGGNDTIDGGQGEDILLGGANNDRIDGGSENDIILGDLLAPNQFGPDGNDSIQAGSGEDIVLGGGGTDTIDGGTGGTTGNDFIFGDYLTATTTPGVDGRDSITAGDGDDFVLGGGEGDTILGGDGTDFISGDNFLAGSGDDSIDGGAGDDTVYGDDGGDTILGGIGNDTITGGLLLSPATDGSDSLDGGVGEDTLRGDAGNDIIDGGSERDTVTYNNSPKGVVVNIDEVTATGYSNPGAGTIRSECTKGRVIPIDAEPSFAIGPGSAQDGFGTVDTLRNLENIIGSRFADVLIGNADRNLIEGAGGNDVLVGNAGDDTLDGGGGNSDTVSYRRDSSKVFVSLELGIGLDGFGNTDTLISIENVIGSDFNDTIIGDGINNPADRVDDLLYGGKGNDTIFARAGDDALFGEDGDDSLSGEEGDDYLVGGPGADTIDGGPGFDVASFATSNAPVYIEILSNDVVRTLRGDGAGAGGDAVGDVFISIEAFEGSPFNDTMLGNQKDNVFCGGAGDDWLAGRDGNDTLYGEGDNDTIDGGNGDDLLKGGAGNDTLSGRNGADTMDGGAGDDFLYGNSGVFGCDQIGDEFIGGSGNDTVEAYLGNDFIVGGLGDDDLFGNAGNDTIFGDDVLLGLFVGGNDTIKGGTGNDLIVDLIGNNIIVGGAGADIIIAGPNSFTLQGGDSANVDPPATSLFSIQGGTGSDTYVISATTRGVVVEDFIARQWRYDTVDNKQKLILEQDKVGLDGLAFTDLSLSWANATTLNVSHDGALLATLKNLVLPSTMTLKSLFTTFVMPTEVTTRLADIDARMKAEAAAEAAGGGDGDNAGGDDPVVLPSVYLRAIFEADMKLELATDSFDDLRPEEAYGDLLPLAADAADAAAAIVGSLGNPGAAAADDVAGLMVALPETIATTIANALGTVDAAILQMIIDALNGGVSDDLSDVVVQELMAQLTIDGDGTLVPVAAPDPGLLA